MIKKYTVLITRYIIIIKLKMSCPIGDNLSIESTNINNEKENNENVVQEAEQAKQRLRNYIQRTNEVDEREENEKSEPNAVPNAQIVEREHFSEHMTQQNRYIRYIVPVLNKDIIKSIKTVIMKH